MPELPEVETTRRGIKPHLENHHIEKIIVRDRRLRWPVPAGLDNKLRGTLINSVKRRAKYLLINTDKGSIIIHLGMSGSLRILAAKEPAEKHDHVDIVLDNKQCLRLRDPRRFGAVLYTSKDPLQHKRLQGLGPEPLSDEFNVDYLYELCNNRKQAIKSLIMNSQVVVGVGNIYACEALFMSGIHPKTAAGRIAHARIERLVDAIKQVLARAIDQGGTTLRDFTRSDGKPGYFKQALQVYGREGEACTQCGAAIKRVVLGQRSTFYCPQCQH